MKICYNLNNNQKFKYKILEHYKINYKIWKNKLHNSEMIMKEY